MVDKKSGKMTLERLATLVVEQSNFVRDELREELRKQIGSQIGGLREEMGAKFFAIHNRIDDLVETRAKRDDLASTNARVTRVERHLGLA